MQFAGCKVARSRISACQASQRAVHATASCVARFVPAKGLDNAVVVTAAGLKTTVN
jgi:hypothetical protein